MSNVENIADHMALACHCGSVRFCLLRSGGIECASCQDRPGLAWRQHDEPVPSDASAEDEDSIACIDCCGKGWNEGWRRVPGHYMGGEYFRVDCDNCGGTGKS